MIRVLCSLFFIVLCGASAPAFSQNQNVPAEAKFFSSMQDIPLVTGLEELRDQTVTFDKPEGRIVESVALIQNGNFESVKKAYDETLPQLGWVRIDSHSYSREKEFLHLNFEEYDGQKFVRVLVRPQEKRTP